MFFGYTLFVGTDIAFSKDWGMKLHIEKATLSGSLAESTFGVSGNRIMLSMYFD